MIVVATHHKTGTVLFGNVFFQIARELSLKFYAGGQKWLPPDGQVWLDEHSQIRTDAFTEFEGVHVIRHSLEVIWSGYRHHLVCNEPWCVSTAIDRNSPVNYDFDGLSYQQKLRTPMLDQFCETFPNDVFTRLGYARVGESLHSP